MHFLLLGLLFVLLAVAPQLWAKSVLLRYSHPREDFESTGGELARILLDRFHMTEIKVESSGQPDHYDPEKKILNLSPQNYSSHSLTAIVTATHETGHAIQDRTEYPLLNVRTRLVRATLLAQRFGSMALLASPILGGLSRSPTVGIILLVVAASSMALSTLVHLLTLPVELDASFRRALPILEAAELIPHQDLDSARKILSACALTYVANSLFSLVNIFNWLRFLRR